MEKDRLYNEFIRIYPRHFFRLVSLRYPLKRQQIINFNHLLAFDRRGLVANAQINWDSDLTEYYSRQLYAKNHNCYITKENNPEYHYLKERNQYILDRAFFRYFRFSSIEAKKMLDNGFSIENVDLDFIRKYNNHLVDYNWRIISRYCTFKITFELIQEFVDKWDYYLLLNNPNVDWSDFRVLPYMLKDWHYLEVYQLYHVLMGQILTDDILEEYIIRLFSEDKYFRVKWKSDLNDKYIIQVILKCMPTNDYQPLVSGIYFSDENYELGEVVDVPHSWRLSFKDLLFKETDEIKTYITFSPPKS